MSRYGIKKKYAHPNSIKLFPEEFFWSCLDEEAPFGSDEGDMALAEYRSWRKENPHTNLLLCMGWIIDSIGIFKLQDYGNNKILDEEQIRKHIYDKSFDDHYNYFTLDTTIIATAFGQLVDEGKIDESVFGLVEISLNKLLIWSKIQNFKSYHKKLLVLKRALFQLQME